MGWPDDVSRMSSDDVAAQDEYESGLTSVMREARAAGYKDGLLAGLRYARASAKTWRFVAHMETAIAHVEATGRLEEEE